VFIVIINNIGLIWQDTLCE